MTLDSDTQTMKMDKSEWMKFWFIFAGGILTQTVVIVMVLAIMRSDVSYNRRDIDILKADQTELQRQISNLTESLNSNLAKIAGDVGEIKGRLRE
jgi:Tfp pilus assembly protein PilN